MVVASAGVDDEQQYVSMLYGRLDQLRERVGARRVLAWRQSGGTPQARTERDGVSAQLGERLAQLDAAEHGLCFGRLDLEDGEQRHVGRLGLLADDVERAPLLVDWRAPAARTFYTATGAHPEGVRRRRHIRTSHRRVTDVQDELLDLADADEDAVTGEAALLAAIAADRTGRMGDIVETIQAEQDRVIRSDHRGVLVVQGGPGTGKTAVALHRAAYLLYTHRERLAKTVVLVVGPNRTFLGYIGRVLPSLGETGVLLATPGDLFPGVRARREEPPAAAEVKGRRAMAGVVAAAVRDRQAVPDAPRPVVIDDGTLLLDPSTAVQARDRARSSGRLHNHARPLVARVVADALAEQATDGLRATAGEAVDLVDADAAARARRRLLAEPAVAALLDELWPVLSPEQLLEDLLASPGRLAAAAPDLPAADRALLHREPGGGWTPADVPLLDEAAELLGRDDRALRRARRRARRRRVEYAQGVLDVVTGSRAQERDDDAAGESEGVDAADLLDAEALADRSDELDRRTPAERAAADREWTFGHLIVDEAQELSEMTWRLLVRRCPTRSMTVVGDVAQTGDRAGTSSWGRVLEPYVGDRWRLEELTVNYRMPVELMAVAARVLAALDPPLDPPRSVRSTGVAPWAEEVPAAALADRLGPIVAREAVDLGEGRLAVVVPNGRLAELRPAVAAAVPVGTTGDQAGAGPDLTAPVVVLGVSQAKGLEFDTVLVVDPARIVAESPRGRNDLYVALTRPTQRLGVVHPGELPPELAGLPPRVSGWPPACTPAPTAARRSPG